MAISTGNMKGFFYLTGLSKYKSPSVQIEDGLNLSLGGFFFHAVTDYIAW